MTGVADAGVDAKRGWGLQWKGRFESLELKSYKLTVFCFFLDSGVALQNDDAES